VGFSVDLAALAKLPMLLDRRADEVDGCRSYLTARAVIAHTGREAATEPLRSAHALVVDRILHTLRGDAERLAARSAAVTSALRSYARSDLAAAARLDGTQPDRTVESPPTASGGAGPDVFDSGWLVADQLRFPPDFRTEYPIRIGPTGPLSLSRLERWLLGRLEEVGGFAADLARPLVAGDVGVADQWAGDWPGVYASAYAFDSLADALGAVAGNLRGSAGAAARVWTGHAAAAMAAALVAHGDRLDRLSSCLRQLAECYRPAAAAAHDAEAGLESFLGALRDQTAPVLGAGPQILTIAPLAVDSATAVRRLLQARGACHDAARRAEALLPQLPTPG
jgi:uncharacterized protein YukE